MRHGDDNIENKAQNGPNWDGLADLACKSPLRPRIEKYARENGIDEREAFRYLADCCRHGNTEGWQETDPDHFDRMAREYIRASDILDKAGDAIVPVAGYGETQVLELFRMLWEITDARTQAHIGRISPGMIDHIPGRIKPDMVAGASEIVRRLVQKVRQIETGTVEVAIPQDAPESISRPIDPVAHIDGIIRDKDPGIYLEKMPSSYYHVSCRVILDEMALLDAVARSREAVQVPEPSAHDTGTVARQAPQGPETDKVMPGIAELFRPWLPSVTDDALLSHIIRCHRRPQGASKIRWEGIQADAVRFWEGCGMTPSEWHDCFYFIDPKTKKEKHIDSNRKTKDAYKDDDKTAKIYGPLKQCKDFGLID